MFWNELIALFGQTQDRVRMLNRAAPGFLAWLRIPWWDDLLLGMSRITDDRKDVMTVIRLPKLVKVAIRNDVSTRLDAVIAATKFARDHRNLRIAHWNIDLALAARGECHFFACW